MDDLFQCEQCAGFFQVLCDDLVCGIGLEALILACCLCKDTLGVNGNGDAYLGILLAYLEVVNAEAGSCVNAACTAFKSYVVADDDK